MGESATSRPRKPKRRRVAAIQSGVEPPHSKAKPHFKDSRRTRREVRSLVRPALARCDSQPATVRPEQANQVQYLPYVIDRVSQPAQHGLPRRMRLATN